MASALAKGLAAVPGIEILQRPEANILFCRLPTALIHRLLDSGFRFYHDRWEPGIVRFVTCFATTEEDVADLISSASSLSGPADPALFPANDEQASPTSGGMSPNPPRAAGFTKAAASN
jgi:threonine aldolase